MTFLGWLAGTQIANWIAGVDHWLAFGLLAFVGIRMIKSGLDVNEESHPVDPSRGTTLVMLSVATSLDALAIGLSLAFLDSNILIASLVIGAVSVHPLTGWNGLRMYIGFSLWETHGDHRWHPVDRYRCAYCHHAFVLKAIDQP